MIIAAAQEWQKIAWLAVAGAAGTLARYYLGGFVQSVVPTALPWGTYVVNAVGCFLFGIVWALADERMLISGTTRMIVLIGFMGAFTTFSTFAFETTQMLVDRQWALAAGNLLAQNVSGIVLLALGISLGRLL